MKNRTEPKRRQRYRSVGIRLRLRDSVRLAMGHNPASVGACLLTVALVAAPTCGEAQAFPAELELSSLLATNGGDGSAGFVLNGIEANDFSGREVSAAGDVNGDGLGDLIVGASSAASGGRSYAGASYVVFGTDQGFLAELELSSLLAENGGDGSTGLGGKRVFGVLLFGLAVGTRGPG